MFDFLMRRRIVFSLVQWKHEMERRSFHEGTADFLWARNIPNGGKQSAEPDIYTPKETIP